ncbi:hypothetical protein KNP414_02865 [Paenibacillus mucilaginosus KNP414]|uniref:Uncharacterized protein n=1 Tax=Paenibacillus mucilaginosus (strain KNP414) TaxID=1036673 RepID=F8FD07_PAEMK|nr:hypothetical protein KNP414_02865 [Paenibacillus mucilaginosus KNP414]
MISIVCPQGREYAIAGSVMRATAGYGLRDSHGSIRKNKEDRMTGL